MIIQKKILKELIAKDKKLLKVLDNKKKCPFCAEEILKEAKKCKFCKEDLDLSKFKKTSTIIDESKIKCPYCKEEVLQDAIKCKHCGTRLTATHIVEDALNVVDTGFSIVWKTIIVLLVLLSVMYMCVASM